MIFNKKMNKSEKLAYYIMKTRMKEYNIKFNEQQSKGEVDFEITSETKTYGIPIEVTSSVNKQFIEMSKCVLKNDCDVIYTKERMKYSYEITITEYAKINFLLKELEGILFSIEKEVGQLNYPTDITDKIKDTKIGKHVESVQIIGEGNKIYITPPCKGGWLSEHEINKTVNNEINKLDNKRKLNKGIKEKHFFLYIDNSNSSVWSSINGIVEPKTVLKTDINDLTVWIFILSFNRKCVIWKANNNSKWEREELFISNDLCN